MFNLLYRRKKGKNFHKYVAEGTLPSTLTQLAGIIYLLQNRYPLNHSAEGTITAKREELKNL